MLIKAQRNQQNILPCQTGIEMKFKNQTYPVLIAPTHIPELNAVEHTSDGIRFGASVTLSTLEEVLTEATQTMPGKEVDLVVQTMTEPTHDQCQ